MGSLDGKQANIMPRLLSWCEDPLRNAKIYPLTLLILFAATTLQRIVANQQCSCSYFDATLFAVLGVLCSYAASFVLELEPRKRSRSLQTVDITSERCNRSTVVPARVVLDVTQEYRKEISSILASVAAPPLQPVSHYEQNSYTDDQLSMAKNILDLLLQFSISQAEFLHAAERSIHFIAQATGMRFSKKMKSFNANVPVDRIELSLFGRWQRHQRNRTFVSTVGSMTFTLPKMRRRVYHVLTQQKSLMQALLLDLLGDGNRHLYAGVSHYQNYACNDADDSSVMTIACLRSFKSGIGGLLSEIANTVLELPLRLQTIDEICRSQGLLCTQLHSTCQSTAYLLALQDGETNTCHTEDLDTKEIVFVRAHKVLIEQIQLLQAALQGLLEDCQQPNSDKNTQTWWENVKGTIKNLIESVHDVDLCLNPSDEQNDHDNVSRQSKDEKVKEISDEDNVEHCSRTTETDTTLMESQQSEQQSSKILVYSCISPPVLQEKRCRRKNCSAVEDTTRSRLYSPSDNFLVELQSRLQSMPSIEEIDANLPLPENDHLDGEMEKEINVRDLQRLAAPLRFENSTISSATFLSQLKATLDEFQLPNLENSSVHGDSS
jgi:hypothetical protein